MRLIFIAISSLWLIGCGVRENFDCKYQAGVGCRSITEVNSMVNDGALTKKNTGPNLVPIKSSALVAHGKVQRVTEEHLRVWVAPHQDHLGHFHEGSVIHTVLKPGFWQTT